MVVLLLVSMELLKVCGFMFCLFVWCFFLHFFGCCNLYGCCMVVFCLLVFFFLYFFGCCMVVILFFVCLCFSFSIFCDFGCYFLSLIFISFSSSFFPSFFYCAYIFPNPSLCNIVVYILKLLIVCVQFKKSTLKKIISKTVSTKVV